MYRGDLKVTDGGAASLAGSSYAGLSAPSSVTAPDSHTTSSGTSVCDPVAHGATTLPSALAVRTAKARARTSPARATARWQRRFVLVLIMVDFVAASAAAAIAFSFRFGDAGGTEADAVFALLLPFAWLASLACNRCYERRFIGAGPTEVERLGRAFLHLFVITAFASYATHADVARGFAFVALPLVFAIDGGGRYAARKVLHRLRNTKGIATVRVLAIGDPQAVAEFADLLHRDRYAGLEVAGACLPGPSTEDPQASRLLADAGVPLLGDVDTILDAVHRCGATNVAVLAGAIDDEKLRWIAWQLEGSETGLIVSPGLTEVAGRRLHIQPVAGLPLLYVDEPQFSGFRRLVKGAFDRIVAVTAMILLLPVLLIVSALVYCTSRGPALFLQTRVGKDGKTFRIVKFRTMHVGAEDRLAELAHRNESADGLLFKIRDDPRVTPVGRVLRRLSIDELPQLLNIMTGSMSLVGPRPPLPSEVEQYGYEVSRRLLVKPGLTGLWQISGRSDLSWEESVRLDLRYIENWSLALDLAVLVKTARAVLRPTGAY